LHEIAGNKGRKGEAYRTGMNTCPLDDISTAYRVAISHNTELLTQLKKNEIRVRNGTNECYTRLVRILEFVTGHEQNLLDFVAEPT
jgi:hypothetical protein